MPPDPAEPMGWKPMLLNLGLEARATPDFIPGFLGRELTGTGFLFMPQRVNGIEAGGAAGGRESEEDAHGGGKDE